MMVAMASTKDLIRERRIGAAMDTIGDQLRVFRKLQKLTQQQIAERAGLTRGTVARLENGDDSVTMSSFLSVCRALGVLDMLVGSLNPYATAIGRAQATRELPKRIRHG
jgi:transcriptional regulator with XRE-family HTH domain